jgi:hypothetical protein
VGGRGGEQEVTQQQASGTHGGFKATAATARSSALVSRSGRSGRQGTRLASLQLGATCVRSG